MELILKEEAILDEIKICQELIKQFEKKLQDAQKMYWDITDRLAVLMALDEKLEKKYKLLNQEDINELIEERSALNNKIKSYQRSISTLQINIEALNELLEDVK